jgi:hypothetical protein
MITQETLNICWAQFLVTITPAYLETKNMKQLCPYDADAPSQFTDSDSGTGQYDKKRVVQRGPRRRPTGGAGSG